MFQKAQKHKAKARIAIAGPSGSGKTYSALQIASGLGQKIAVLDTENDSASLYADRFDFDVCSQASHAPENYVKTIKAAESAGYDVLVIDSLTHAWSGKDGALEMVDKAAARNNGNSYAGWRNVTPEHNKLVDAIIGSKMHIIATMRSKSEYVQEKDAKGKTVIRKIGMAPIQRDGMEYEFTIFGDMNLDHELVIQKSRCPEFQDAVIEKPTADFGRKLIAWLNDGTDAVVHLTKDQEDFYKRAIEWGKASRAVIESHNLIDAWDSAVKSVEIETIRKLSADIGKAEKERTQPPQTRMEIQDEDIPM